jgi:hypothetical protein
MSAPLHNITKNHNSSQNLLNLDALRYRKKEEEVGSRKKTETMPNAQCPMPDAQYPMPNARCPMPDARCPMPNRPVFKLRSQLAVKICQTSL